jgi:hypothetical protein
VVTVRVTRKLLKYLRVDALCTEVASTTVLGDRYANLLFTRHLRLVICMSERSFFPVFVEAKDRSTFVERFREAVRAGQQKSTYRFEASGDHQTRRLSRGRQSGQRGESN